MATAADDRFRLTRQLQTAERRWALKGGFAGAATRQCGRFGARVRRDWRTARDAALRLAVNPWRSRRTECEPLSFHRHIMLRPSVGQAANHAGGGSDL